MRDNRTKAKHVAGSPRRVLRPILFTIGLASSIFVLRELGLISYLSCSQVEIDIRSGRIRRSYLVLCIPVYQSVRDSALTMALTEAERQETARTWCRVTVLSPGASYSPHYAYHLAVYQIYQLEQFWKTADFTREERRESARRLLLIWQRDGNYSGADDYINSLRSRDGGVREKARD